MANTHVLDLESSSSQYASITDASQTGLDLTGDFTVEFWFKPESNNINQAIVSKFSATSGNYSYRIGFDDTGKVAVFISGDGTTSNRDVYASTSAVLTNGVYAHFAVTYDVSARSVTVYKDGLAIAGTTTPTGTVTAIYDGTAAFNIGAFGSGTEMYVDGLVDDVRVWSDIRTATEIQDNIGTELVGNEANLVGYWKLNNDYTDSTSNGNDLTASGSPVFTTSVPFEDVSSITTASTKVLDLEASSSQYVSITDASQTGLDLTGDFTIEAWVKTESLTTDFQLIVAKDNVGVSRNYAVHTRTDGSIHAYVFGTGGSTQIESRSSAGVITNGVWYHVAVACNVTADTIDIYVNGREVSYATDSSGTVTSLTDSTAPFMIGARQSSGTAELFFDGQIRDVRVFNDIRTQSEIVSDARTTTVSDANLQGEWSLNNVYTDASGNGNTLTASGSPVFVNQSNEIANSLISYWDLDETSGTRADSHGANDLTDNNTVLYGTGIIGNGADFEADNSEYLSVASDLGITGGSYTLSAWIKPETLPSSDADPTASTRREIVVNEDGGTGTSGHIHLSNVSGTQRVYASRWRNGVAIDKAYGDFSAPTDSMTHVVSTYNGSVVTIYINGVLYGTAASSGSGSVTTDFTNIGRDTAANPAYFDGIIDEVGIWSRALTAGEVSNLYNAGSGLPYEGAGGYTITADTQTYTLTGIDATLLRSLVMIASVGSFTLTGIAIAFSRAYGLVASVGSFILTGISAVLRSNSWANISKNTSTWTDTTKSSSDWTDTTKSSSDWTNVTKN